MLKVSVIITTYNQAKFLPQAIESVLQQKLDDFEVIIIDDGSIDNTAEVVASYNDLRIRYHWQENQERSAARNRGIELSRGEYITFLDADDWYLPGKLACQTEALDAFPEIGMAASGWFRVDEKGNILKQHSPWESYPIPTLRDWLFSGITVVGANLIRRKFLEAVGGFNRDLSSNEDTHLWVRLAWTGCGVRWVNKPVMMQRMHTSNTVHNGRRMRDSRLKMLSMIYQTPGADIAVGMSKQEAFGLAYMNGSLHLYSMGYTEEAEADLSQALQLAPFLSNNRGEQVLRTLWSRANHPITKNPIEFLETVLYHLPPELARLEWQKSRILAGIWIDKAFEAYQHNDMKKVRQFLLRALLIYPGWIRNRGVVSIGFESVLGSSVTRLLKKLIKDKKTGYIDIIKKTVTE